MSCFYMQALIYCCHGESDGQIQNDFMKIVIESHVFIWFVNRIVDLKYSIWFRFDLNLLRLNLRFQQLINLSLTLAEVLHSDYWVVITLWVVYCTKLWRTGDTAIYANAMGLGSRILAAAFRRTSNQRISYHSASTVTHSEKVQLSSIGSPVRAFQWAQDEHRTLSLSLPNGGSKTQSVQQLNNNSKLWYLQNSTR